MTSPGSNKRTWDGDRAEPGNPPTVSSYSRSKVRRAEDLDQQRKIKETEFTLKAQGKIKDKEAEFKEASQEDIRLESQLLCEAKEKVKNWLAGCVPIAD